MIELDWNGKKGIHVGDNIESRFMAGIIVFRVYIFFWMPTIYFKVRRLLSKV